MIPAGSLGTGPLDQVHFRPAQLGGRPGSFTLEKSMTSYYVIIKQGVYQHGAYGPYPSQEAASVRARELAQADKDDYHVWQVHEITPDGLGEVLDDAVKRG